MSLTQRKPTDEVAMAAFIEGLKEHKAELDQNGLEFTNTFMAAQALIGTIGPSSEGAHEITRSVVSMADKANQVAIDLGGQPVQGVRHARYFLTGRTVPEKEAWNPFSNLPFRGILRGVEIVEAPGKPEDGPKLCVVIDPLITSDHDGIKTYYEDRHWGTYPDGISQPPIDDRIWVAHGGIQEVRINTDYISGAISNARRSADALRLTQEHFADVVATQA